MLKIFLPSSALLLGVMYVNVYAMMCSFSKKNLLKIKNDGARLVRLFQILKISCSCVTTISLVKQTQNVKVTRKILEREKKKKTETENMGRAKIRFNLLSRLYAASCTNHHDAFIFSFPFLARYYVPYLNTFFLYCCCFLSDFKRIVYFLLVFCVNFFLPELLSL